MVKIRLQRAGKKKAPFYHIVIADSKSPRDGKIIEENLNKNKYTIEDLMSQLREHDVFKIQDVKFAMIENNGNLSVIKNSDEFNAIPLNVIEDGNYAKENLEMLKMQEKDVDKLLK